MSTRAARSLFVIAIFLCLILLANRFLNAPVATAQEGTPSAPTAGPQTFSNTAAITIVDTAAANPEAASPYPSNIAVNLAGTVTNLTVTINGFSHIDPLDVDMMLIAPGGQRYIFWSDVGTSTDINAPGINVTVSDAAANFLPNVEIGRAHV